MTGLADTPAALNSQINSESSQNREPTPAPSKEGKYVLANLLLLDPLRGGAWGGF